ncbi:MAG: NDP-sugar synthase [Pontiella sp.]
MIAVLDTSNTCDWAENLGDTPWVLLPVANRPMLDYWLEACTGFGVRSVRVILGEGAKKVEDYIATGDRWNMVVEYVFSRSTESREDYLRAISADCKNGLVFFGGPFFLRKGQGFRSEHYSGLSACCHTRHEEPYFIYATNEAELEKLLSGGNLATRGLNEIQLHPFIIESVGDYYTLNMKMVAGEFSRYVTAGFSAGDGNSIGFNVRTPPSSHLETPVLVGDNCRFGAMTTVGPNAIIANHVIVDAYSELTDCLILDDTYIGRNLEIRKKIVSGNRIIDPSDGTAIQIDDAWLVARNRPDMRTEDLARYLILWCIALVLAVLQMIPYIVLLTILHITGIARFTKELFHDPHTGYIQLPVFRKMKQQKSIFYRVFLAFSLDRFPRILRVLCGRMFLCGQLPMRHPEDDAMINQLPHYYPGVFCYQDYNKDSDPLTDSLWYAHIRSLFEDLKILIKALVSRFVSVGRKTSMDEI